MADPFEIGEMVIIDGEWHPMERLGVIMAIEGDVLFLRDPKIFGNPMTPKADCLRVHRYRVALRRVDSELWSELFLMKKRHGDERIAQSRSLEDKHRAECFAAIEAWKARKSGGGHG